MKRLKVKNARSGETVAPNAYLADNPLTRMRGLLGRASLPAGEAMVIRPSSSIHTAFMRFAIDVIYLNKQDEVVKVVPNLAPFRLSAARGAHTVIEMSAGATAALDLRQGDRLMMSPRDEERAGR